MNEAKGHAPRRRTPHPPVNRRMGNNRSFTAAKLNLLVRTSRIQTQKGLWNSSLENFHLLFCNYSLSFDISCTSALNRYLYNALTIARLR